MTDDFPIGVMIGRWAITDLLDGEFLRGRYRVSDGVAPGLLTVAPTQKLDHRELAVRHALALPRVTPLLHIGSLATSVARLDGMIEQEPSGRPLRAASATTDQLLGVVRELCDVVIAANEQDLVLRGIRPELVYVDDSCHLTAVAPRCEPFLMTATSPSVGVVHCFDRYYMPPEVLNVRTATPTSDVFSLAAIAVEAITGEHPFVGDHSIEQLMSITSGERRAWHGDDRLRGVLDRALDRDPAKRPSVRELAAALA